MFLPVTSTSVPPLRRVESDSDSDLSLEDDQSGSYASTHSSDSEDEDGPLPPEECWENLAAHSGKRPHTQGGDEDGARETGTESHGRLCFQTTGCWTNRRVQTDRSETFPTTQTPAWL